MGDTNDDLDEAVTFLVKSVSSSSTVKKAGLQVQLQVDTLEEISRQHGLSSKQICSLMDAVASNNWSGRICHRVIHALLPANTVPEQAVLRAVSYICTNKPLVNTQALLVRWILLVYDVMDSHDQLHGLYGVLFYFLENETMCPYVCHLLYLLTRREDVRLFRVRAVANLQKRQGNQPYILGLLSVYKAYCPELVALTLPRIPKSFFKQTEKSWAGYFQQVQARRHDLEGQESTRHTTLEEPSRTLICDTDHLLPAAKRRRVDVIPPVLTCTVLPYSSHGRQKHQGSYRVKVPIKSVSSFGELLKNIDNVELPGQMASVLANSNLQHVVSLHSDVVVGLRIGYWLHHTLEEEFFRQSGEKALKRQAQLLESLVQFANFLKEGMPVWEEFLTRYLHIWNGLDHRPLVLGLITRLPLLEYQALNDLILEPLRKLFFISSVYFKCEVLQCLTLLLRNYAAVEWPRYKHTLRLQADQANIAQSFVEPFNCHSSFVEHVEKFNGPETVAGLARFIDSLCRVALPIERDHVLLSHCVGDFCCTLSSLHELYAFPLVLLPNRAIIYRQLLSDNPVSLSRLAAIIARYRAAFVDIRRVNSKGSTEEQQVCTKSLEQIQHFNVFLLDVSDTLWRNRSFKTHERQTIFKLVSQEQLRSVEVDNENGAFSVTRHPALLGLVWKFLKETQPPGKQVHPSSIRHSQEKLLEYLEEQAVTGISQFIKTSIRRPKKSDTTVS